MKQKYIAAVVLALMFVLAFSTASLAAPGIMVNGSTLEAEAINDGGRVLVPLRAIFTALGQEVTWNAADRSITSGNIWLQIDNTSARVGKNSIELDVPAKIIDGRTYVPVRFIAESLGKQVKWVGDANRVEISESINCVVYDSKARFEGNTLVVTVKLWNTGKGPISKIVSWPLKVSINNQEVASKTFTNIAVSIAPEEKKDVELRFEGVAPASLDSWGLKGLDYKVLE